MSQPIRDSLTTLSEELKDKAAKLSRFAAERAEVRGTVGKHIMEARASELTQVCAELDKLTVSGGEAA